MKYNIGIAGFGHVGNAMKKLFPESVVYDKNKNIGSINELNNCYCVFICVPTPQGKSGECNTTIVEELISMLDVELIIIRSTVYVGFTDKMVEKYNKNIVFQPEYYGETVHHPYAELLSRHWISLGGSEKAVNMAVHVYQQVYNSSIKIYQDSAKNVEFAKYMENAFFAAKVTFCNEMYDIAEKLGVNYNRAREMWLADERIGPFHTFVYPENRGYGGSCLPKDIASIIYQAEEYGYEPAFLKSVVEKNNMYKQSR